MFQLERIWNTHTQNLQLGIVCMFECVLRPHATSTVGHKVIRTHFRRTCQTFAYHRRYSLCMHISSSLRPAHWWAPTHWNVKLCSTCARLALKCWYWGALLFCCWICCRTNKICFCASVAISTVHMIYICDVAVSFWCGFMLNATCLA